MDLVRISDPYALGIPALENLLIQHLRAFAHELLRIVRVPGCSIQVAPIAAFPLPKIGVADVNGNIGLADGSANVCMSLRIQWECGEQ